MSSDAELIAALQQALGCDKVEFHAGVSYRNLLIFRGGGPEPIPFSADTRTTPPHDLTDRVIYIKMK